MKILLPLGLCSVLLSPWLIANEDDHHGHGHTETAHTDAEENELPSLNLSPAQRQAAGILERQAQTGSLQHKIRLYGFLREDPARTSHIRARFPGTVRKVFVQTGDYVRAGQILAEIESSQSLSLYQVQAPFSGQITERHANPGELTLEQSLFTLSDDRQLYAELQVFSSQMPEIRPGLNLELRSAGQHQTSRLMHLLPNGQNTNGTLLARAAVKNPDKQLWPGMFVEADVFLADGARAIRVENTALQRIDNQTVVFSCANEQCRALPVETGPRDGHYTLIRAGLEAGESYVVQGSYLLKAELEKSSAGHSH